MNIMKAKPRFFKCFAIRIAAMLLVLCATSTRVQAQTSKLASKDVKTKSKNVRTKSDLSAELRVVLKSHPDILAAQARVRLAEAELNQVKLQIAQEVVMLQNQLEPLEHTAELLMQQFRAGQGGQADLMKAQTELATLRAKKMLMLGSRKVTGSAHVYKAEPPAPVKEAPMAAMAEKIRSALLAKTDIQFIDIPITDAVEFIGDLHNIPMHIHRAEFEDADVELDISITLAVTDIPLGAAIEALEDRYPVRFLVRNYGILVTVKGSDSDEKYMSALELWKQKEEGRFGP